MMRAGAGSSHLPAPTLANATHWEEGAMTNPNIAHPAIPRSVFLGPAEQRVRTKLVGNPKKAA